MKNYNIDDLDVSTLLDDREALERILANYKMMQKSLEHSPLPYMVMDQDGKLLAWNKPYENLHEKAFKKFGDKIKKGNLTSKDLIKLSAPKDLSEEEINEYVEKFVQFQRQGIGKWQEMRYENAGYHHVVNYALPDGTIAGLATNINDLKQREEELETAKALAESTETCLKEAISILDDGFVIFDQEDRLFACNDAFREQFGEGVKHIADGLTYREMTLNLAKSGIIPGIEGKEEEFVDGLVEKRSSEEGYSNTFQRHDGKWIRQRDKRTESGMLVGVRTDITELKENEIAIEQTSERFRRTSDAMAQGLTVVENGIIVTINKKAIELLETNEETLFEGQSLDEFLKLQVEAGHYGEQEKGAEFIAKQLAKIKASETYQVVRTTPSGRVLTVDCVSSGGDNLFITYTDITEQQKRDSEFEKTSQMLIDISEAMTQGMIVVENDKVQFFNPRATELLNLKDDVLFIGAPMKELLEFQLQRGDFGEGEAARQFCDAAIENLQSWEEYEVERKTVDGKTLLVNGVPSEQKRWLLTFTDITNTKERESAFEKTSQMLHEISEAMTQGMIVLENFKIQYFNERAIELLNVPKDRLCVDLEFKEFLKFQLERGDYGEGLVAQEFYDKALQDLSLRKPYEIERTTANGKSLMVNAVPSGQNGWLLTYTDITQAKERELAVKRTSSLLQNTTNAMAQGIIVFGKDNIELVNPVAGQMVDTPESVLKVGRPWREFVEYQYQRGDYGSGEAGLEKYRSILDDIKERRGHSIQRSTSDGRTLQINGNPTGEYGWIATYTDITELKNREDDLKKATKVAKSAERAKSEFLANMSHEIRTPMNGVMGMAELLAGTELDLKQKMFTDVIIKSGASLLTIINDILDFSKIDAGQMELDPAPFHLADAIEDVATLVSSKVAEKDLELIVRISPMLPEMIVGDVGRLRQIVTNLLGNAVKFTEKGHVYVNVDGTTIKRGSNNITSLHFRVEDTGIGISEDGCSKIFSKFSQVDASATRKHEGTGLGLSIASSLVELMNGEIGVESEVGSGSTFWFKIDLPIHNEPSERISIPQEVIGAKILIVDDNAVNRSILTEQMYGWQFDGAAVSSGAEAFQVVDAVMTEGLELDLIVLDYQMPDMCGEEVLEKLRRNEQSKDIPVLMLTSVDSTQATKRLNKLGVEGNLIKPARSSLLLETIVQIISQRRKNKALPALDSSPDNKIAETVSAPKAEEATPNPLDIISAIERASPPSDDQMEEPISNPSDVDILVAEDNEVNQIVIKQVLTEIGVNFHIVENGSLALSHYKKHRPKLILMDVSMPVMNGKDCTIAIRKFEAENNLPAVPIIGVTAHALKGDKESFFEVGMDDYLSKPVSPKKMAETISLWLGQKSDEQQTA